MTDTARLHGFLTEIDLADFLSVFEENDIGMDLVPDLTQDDLKELGLNIGQRRRLAMAVDQLTNVEGEAREARLKPERRQISVLFADLIGSTRLSTLFDAEQWATILQDYHGVCASASENWGGRLVSQFGDGCMAIFGHPRINENDAERAAHAGLEMIRRMGEAGPFNGHRLRIRVAIATGRVVIGDLTGRSDPNSLAGETPNLAARLQGIADPQTLVISDATNALIRNAFETSSRGTHELKGFAEPVEAWRVDRPRTGSARAAASESSAAMLGRETEIAALRAAWEEVRKGQTRAIIVDGEAGIGKSQLISAFGAELEAAEPDLTRFKFYCSAFGANSALHPFEDQFATAAGVRSKDTAAEKAAKIADYAASHPAIDEAGAALVSALSPKGGASSLSMNPVQQKEATLALIADIVRHEAASGPVLMQFEDAHWADASSIEALSRLIGVGGDTAPAHPILIVISTRPGFAPPWPPTRWLRTVTLGKLDGATSTALVRSIVGDAPPDARVRDIVTKAGGVPLFLREIAAAAAESGAAGEAIEVPLSLEDSLMSRVDRLGPATKAVAQSAATLGRTFSADLLKEVADLEEVEVDISLGNLAKADLIQPVGEDGETYMFRHALLQDASYQSLLIRQAKDMHTRIVGILAADKEGVHNAGPDVLARHYIGAEMPMMAVSQLIAAGQAATSCAAQIEANALFRTALQELAKMGDDPAAQGMEAMVQALLGQSLIATLGYGSPDIAPSFERARRISKDMENTPLLMSSTYGLWAVSAARGERDKALTFSAEATAMFRDSNQPLFALGARFMDGVTRLFQGDFDTAKDSLKLAVEGYDPVLHPLSVQAFGDDLGTFALTYLQWISAIQGDFVEATTLNAEAMSIASGLKDKAIDTRNLAYAMSGAQMVEAYDMTLTMSEQVIALSTELCYPHWAAVGRFGRGWAKCHLSGDPDGVEDLKAGLAFFDQIGQRTPLSSFYSGYADAMIALKRFDEAQEIAEIGIRICETELDASFLPNLKRLRAYCIAESSRAEGVNAMRAALLESKEMGASYFEYLCALGLARLEDENALKPLREARAKIKAPYPLPVLMEADQRLAAA